MPRPPLRAPRTWRHIIPSLALAACAACLRGEDAEHAAPPEDWSLHGQNTVIEQGHGPIHSPYAGLNSLNPRAEDKHTITLTGFIGRRLWTGGELYYNPEFSQGTGVSNTVGMAGFPNGEATRAGAANLQYNTARLFLRQTFDLGGEREAVAADQNQLGGQRPVDRLTITVGKLSATDLFDANRYSHDPRTQFLNWSLMDNGAWDYPADVKGYTGGATVEWNQRERALRWGAFMEPVAANERQLDRHLSRALGQVLEWEERTTIDGRAGAWRLLGFWNRAHMGSYNVAVRSTTPPDVTATRRYRSKAGLGVSWDQEIADAVGLFGRAGFNDGRHETWAFTEIDRTISAGLSFGGKHWGRDADTLGIAIVANGLSGEHRRYLAAGGYGFIVGDGRLSYAPEQIAEAYYNWKPAAWLGLSVDAQAVAHPGYNRDRGPAAVFGVRSHVAF